MLKRVLDPLMRLWSPFFLVRAGLASSALPQPADAPTVRIPGPDPDRVLVIGGGILMSFGVLSHSLGLAGHLFRQVSGTTGRGAEVEIIARSDLTIADIPLIVADLDLGSYDAVLLIVGVTDSMRRTSPRSWRRCITALIHDICERTASRTQILLVGVQPVRLVTTLDNRVGLFAELHARMLDRESMRACAGSSQATYIPFHPEAGPSERYRTSELYGVWARQLSPTVAAVLQNNHPFGDFSI